MGCEPAPGPTQAASAAPEPEYCSALWSPAIPAQGLSEPGVGTGAEREGKTQGKKKEHIVYSLLLTLVIFARVEFGAENADLCGETQCLWRRPGKLLPNSAAEQPESQVEAGAAGSARGKPPSPLPGTRAAFFFLFFIHFFFFLKRFAIKEQRPGRTLAAFPSLSPEQRLQTLSSAANARESVERAPRLRQPAAGKSKTPRGTGESKPPAGRSPACSPSAELPGEERCLLPSKLHSQFKNELTTAAY